MRKKVVFTDRMVVGLLGLALVAGGLALVDWRYRRVLGGWSDTLETGPVASVTDAAWWPWALAAVGVVVGLLGLAWLLAHLRTDRPGDLRLGGSSAVGLLEADLSSVAGAVAERFAELAPVSGARGTTGRDGSRALVEVRAHLEADADTASLTAAAQTCAREVAQAFPDGEASFRVLLSAPRRRRRGAQRVQLQ